MKKTLFLLIAFMLSAPLIGGDLTNYMLAPQEFKKKFLQVFVDAKGAPVVDEKTKKTIPIPTELKYLRIYLYNKFQKIMGRREVAKALAQLKIDTLKELEKKETKEKIDKDYKSIDAMLTKEITSTLIANKNIMQDPNEKTKEKLVSAGPFNLFVYLNGIEQYLLTTANTTITKDTNKLGKLLVSILMQTLNGLVIANPTIEDILALAKEGGLLFNIAIILNNMGVDLTKQKLGTLGNGIAKYLAVNTKERIERALNQKKEKSSDILKKITSAKNTEKYVKTHFGTMPFTQLTTYFYDTIKQPYPDQDKLRIILYCIKFNPFRDDNKNNPSYLTTIKRFKKLTGEVFDKDLQPLFDIENFATALNTIATRP